MAERERPTTTCGGCWPSKREAFQIGLTLGHSLATAEFHKMQQQQPKSGDDWIQKTLSGIKVWVDRYELAQKLWALRRPAGLTLLIASWWDQFMWLVRLIVG